jgi:predicted TIM-barrel enzyme
LPVFLRTEAPGLGIGIIAEAHDTTAALAIAHAAGAEFVRIKVFVGGMMTAQGPRHGIGAQAVAYRASSAARTSRSWRTSMTGRRCPCLRSPRIRREWAQKTGADGLILTGSSFADSLDRIARARQAGHRAPDPHRSGVTDTNVAEALGAADGVIVSTSLMRRDAGSADVLRWDRDLTRRFMDAARVAEERRA